MTKTFVATMVLRLAEKGRLRIDDPIAAFVPTYMPSTKQFRIRDLLGHTSGYADVECYPIIKRASGTTVGDVFERAITAPLMLANDADFERLASFAGRIAHGYDLQHKRLVDTFVGARDLGVPTGDWGPVWTDGGIVATAGGVARFTDALYGRHMLRPATLAEMLEPGPDHSYGLGTFRARFDGHTWQGHDGFYYGFTTETFYDFSRRLTTTVLTNRTDNNDPARTIWDRLAIVYDHSTGSLVRM